MAFLVSKLDGESGIGSSDRSRLSVVKGLELIKAVASAMIVRKVSSFKGLSCVLNRDERIDLMDHTCLSHLKVPVTSTTWKFPIFFRSKINLPGLDGKA